MQRWAFCLEQTLGHRAHSKNLQRMIGAAPAQVDVHLIEYSERKRRVPAPWAVRGSFAALRTLRTTKADYQTVFYHTQTVALFAPFVRNAHSYVVSVDATPLQMDAVGQWYEHRIGMRASEAVKTRWYRRVLQGAEAVVAWSEWASNSLVDDYGVERSRILIAHPGAPEEFFGIPRPTTTRTPTILFVGGDFERKGGPALLRAFRHVADRANLLIVSDAEIGDSADVTQLRGVRPGTPELLAAYAQADIFCLPTRGDCTPVVLGEAMAAGLPVITTDIGSNFETLQHSATGLLIRVDDDAGLIEALTQLVDNPDTRQRMGDAARRAACERFDASRNSARILCLLESISS